MIKLNCKPVYAEGNAEWRICYHANGYWKLQEYHPLPKGTDLRLEQEWQDHNRFMAFGDAINALGRYAKRRA